MTKQSAVSMRQEIPDGFLGAHKNREREIRRKKFESLEQKKTNKEKKPKKSKNLDIREEKTNEFKYPSRKNKKPVKVVEKIETTEEKKFEISESLVTEVKNLEKRITEITKEIDDNYYEKPFLSLFHSAEVDDFMKRGNDVLNSFNKPEAKMIKK